MSDFTLGTIRRPGFGLRVVATHAAHAVQAMLRARATRRLLADMDDRLLADIGVGRGDALHEARRPMWDLRPSRR